MNIILFNYNELKLMTMCYHFLGLENARGTSETCRHEINKDFKSDLIQTCKHELCSSFTHSPRGSAQAF